MKNSKRIILFLTIFVVNFAASQTCTADSTYGSFLFSGGGDCTGSYTFSYNARLNITCPAGKYVSSKISLTSPNQSIMKISSTIPGQYTLQKKTFFQGIITAMVPTLLTQDSVLTTKLEIMFIQFKLSQSY